MTTNVLPQTESLPVQSGRSQLYHGWVNVVLAALAMTATLPGRTHGLGLITKQLTEDVDLKINDTLFGDLNFWAILMGSALCLPVGWCIDRFGVRSVLVVVAVALGLAVVGMSAATGVVFLFVTLTLVRGLGQGALSVVSMAMVGKWFTRRLPIVMGVFTVLLTIGMVLSISVGDVVKHWGWRTAWFGVGMFMFVVLAPLGWLFVRSTPEEEADQALDSTPKIQAGQSLAAALLSPAFWMYTTAMCLFNLVWSAITLFNEKLLEHQKLDHDTYMLVMMVLMAIGLPTNLVAGWLATRWPMGRILAVGMVLLGGSLLLFPRIDSNASATLFGLAFGAAGGIITVVWFAMYGRAYGRQHLGSIQAVAQVLAVFASALGPAVLMRIYYRTGSYALVFHVCAALAFVLAAGVWIVRLPTAESAERN